MTHQSSYLVMIPTVDRIHKLLKVIQALNSQEVRPSRIMVCDSSSERSCKIEDLECLTSSPIDLIHSPIKSSAIQRNVLLNQWHADYREIDFGLFLDDDTVPSNNYSSSLLEVLISNPTVGGVSGVTISTTTPPQKTSCLEQGVLRTFFLTGNPGSLLRSGINVGPDASWTHNVRCDWLFACSMWRREATQTTRFPNDWMGYAIAEDVYFSSQISRNWTLIVVPKATLLIDNYGPSITNPSLFRDEVVHRYRIVRDRPNRKFTDLVKFYWSNFGLLMLTSVAYLRTRDRHFLDRLVGVAMGLLLSIQQFILRR